MTLMTCSVIGLLISPQNIAFIGLLSIFWGGFTFMRILSLYEVSEHIPNTQNTSSISKRTNHLTAALPYDLTARMNSSRYFKRGENALNSLDPRNITWLVIASIYVIYSLHLHSSGLPLTQTIQDLSIFFIIGAAFWNGQSYAYGANSANVLLVLLIALLAISAYTAGVHHMNFSETVIQNNILHLSQNFSLLALSFLGIYCIVTSLYAGLSYIRNLPIALISSALMLCMAAIYIASPLSTPTALWISFWGLFSLLWIKCFTHKRKRYVLYQCQ